MTIPNCYAFSGPKFMAQLGYDLIWYITALNVLVMLHLIEIIEDSKIPKYKQIINCILTAIENGSIQKNDKLPSVNELLIEFDISRDTIVRGYDHLKRIGLVESVPGKGYYVLQDSLELKAKVFLLFNKLSPHKKLIYDAFSQELGDRATIDFFIYDNNYRQFKNLILASKAREYTHYAIICHFEEGGDDLIGFVQEHISKTKLVILDKQVEQLSADIASVYQDFSKDIYSALVELNTRLAKYLKIKLILAKRNYHPIEIQKGFEKFCGEYAYEYESVESIEAEEITKDTVYISLTEEDLVVLIKKIKDTPLVVGKDIGVVSYNDTPIKEVLLDGISVVSTDFGELGRKAAEVILQNKKGNFPNPFYTLPRNSL